MASDMYEWCLGKDFARKPSARIAGFMAEIFTRDLQNTKQAC
jgi:hypothetical protein